MQERPETRLETLTRGLADNARQALVDRFGRPPTWFAVAPGRVNLIGEHTDYNEGFVLPMAIERHTVIAAAPAPPHPARLQLYSATLDASVDIPLDSPQRRGSPSWANYVRGVIAGFQLRGGRVPSLCVAIASDVPLGGGLASSAALEVAMATLLEAVTGMTLDPIDKARLCQKAEHEFAGVPCGLMDQLVCILGEQKGPLLIDCRADVSRVVPFADRTACILIANSNVRHSLGDGAYARRRAECESAARQLSIVSLRDASAETVEAARHALGPVLHRRARHVVTENERTLEAAEAFEAGAFQRAGLLLYESHRSLRDDYEVSCLELDVLVDVAQGLGELGGVYGARMTGGGFGGCTVTLARAEHVEAVSEALRSQYERRIGRTVDLFVTHPARGAHSMDLGSRGSSLLRIQQAL